MFKVSPHGKLPLPNEDDYNNINPITYEGDFYQEEEDGGEFDVDALEEDLEGVAQVCGEAVKDIKDLDMLSKLHLHDIESDDDEPPPFEGQPYYSHDSDSDYESDEPR